MGLPLFPISRPEHDYTEETKRATQIVLAKVQEQISTGTPPWISYELFEHMVYELHFHRVAASRAKARLIRNGILIQTADRRLLPGVRFELGTAA